jgi:hypothetical protein
MNGPDQDPKKVIEFAVKAGGYEPDGWDKVFKPEICRVMISYALYGWRNFQSLLPAHASKKNWE